MDFHLKKKIYYRWPLIVWPISGIIIGVFSPVFVGFILGIPLMLLEALLRITFFSEKTFELIMMFYIPSLTIIFGFFIGFIHYVREFSSRDTFNSTWLLDTLLFLIAILPSLLLLPQMKAYLGFYALVPSLLISNAFLTLLVNRRLILFLILSVILTTIIFYFTPYRAIPFKQLHELDANIVQKVRQLA